MIPNKSPRIGRSAATNNMKLALETMYAGIDAPEGVDKMMIFYGPSGYGKSVAVTHVAATTDAVYVELNKIWTDKWLLTKIARELDLAYIQRTTTGIFDQVVEKFIETQRPLIIDEADYMIDRGSPEILRDIHIKAKTPILMVGEESFLARIKRWDRFDSRILLAKAATPSSFEDGHLLRDIYCDRVAIADDLTDHFTQQYKGVTRRIVNALQNAQTIAIENIAMEKLVLDGPLDLAAWSKCSAALVGGY